MRDSTLAAHAPVQSTLSRPKLLLALMQGSVLQANVMVSPNTPLQRVLGLAHNDFTGIVPVFLAKSAVPPLLKISLVVR